MKSPCLGWDVAHDDKSYVEVVGAYNFSSQFDGRYFLNLTDLGTTVFWNNNGVYEKEKDDKCIWWQSQPRRAWWIGYCKDVGSNTGFAYLNEDESCPYVDGTDWRNPPIYWKLANNHQWSKGYTVSK